MFKFSKSELAFKLLSYLKEEKPKSLVKAEELRKHLQISKPYLEQVVAGLCDIGVLETVRGRNGGYRLSKRYGTITVWDVISRFVSKQYKQNDTVIDDLYKSVKDTANSISLRDI